MSLKHLYCRYFRHVWLSFQSTLHFSLAVLVHYRSREDIEIQVKYTTSSVLPSQGTRLCKGGHCVNQHSCGIGCSPFTMSFPINMHDLNHYTHTKFQQAEACASVLYIICSLFNRHYLEYPMWFFFLHLLICLNSVGNYIRDHAESWLCMYCGPRDPHCFNLKLVIAVQRVANIHWRHEFDSSMICQPVRITGLLQTA